MDGEVDEFELTTDDNGTNDEVATDETEATTDTAAADEDFEFQFNPDE